MGKRVNTGTEIMVNGMKTVIINPELAKGLANYEVRRLAGIAGTWEDAKFFRDAFEGDLISEDFEKQKDFCDFIGRKPSDLTQKISGLNICEQYFNGDTHKKAVDFFYELRAFKGEKATLDFDDFVAWLAGDGIAMWEFGTSALKSYIRDYKKEKANTINTNSEEIDAEPEEQTDAPDESVVYVEFEINGKKYKMPEEILAQYEVE